MKKIVVFLIIFLTLTYIVVHQNNENEKMPPVAAKFNHYIAQVAQANQQCYELQNKINTNWNNKTLGEKQALFDQYLMELELTKKRVQNINPPSELADLKVMYLNMFDYLEESTRMEKRQLMPLKASNSEIGEEQELESSKALTIYGQIEANVNSLEEVYHIKCLNKPAVINTFKISGDKYFVDVK